MISANKISMSPASSSTALPVSSVSTGVTVSQYRETSSKPPPHPGSRTSSTPVSVQTIIPAASQNRVRRPEAIPLDDEMNLQKSANIPLDKTSPSSAVTVILRPSQTHSDDQTSKSYPDSEIETCNCETVSIIILRFITWSCVITGVVLLVMGCMQSSYPCIVAGTLLCITALGLFIQHSFKRIPYDSRHGPISNYIIVDALQSPLTEKYDSAKLSTTPSPQKFPPDNPSEYDQNDDEEGDDEDEIVTSTFSSNSLSPFHKHSNEKSLPNGGSKCNVNKEHVQLRDNVIANPRPFVTRAFSMAQPQILKTPPPLLRNAKQPSLQRLNSARVCSPSTPNDSSLCRYILPSPVTLRTPSSKRPSANSSLMTFARQMSMNFMWSPEPIQDPTIAMSGWQASADPERSSRFTHKQFPTGQWSSTPFYK